MDAAYLVAPRMGVETLDISWISDMQWFFQYLVMLIFYVRVGVICPWKQSTHVRWSPPDGLRSILKKQKTFSWVPPAAWNIQYILKLWSHQCFCLILELDFNNTYLCPCDDLYIHVIGVNMLYIYELYRQVQMIHICGVYIICGCTIYIYMYMVNACRIYMLWTYRDVCKLRDVQHEYMQQWPLPQPLQ